MRIPPEQIEPLAKHLAENYVYDWVTGPDWMGYPSGHKQEREAVEEYMPTARSVAREYLHLAGIEVDEEGQ